MTPRRLFGALVAAALLVPVAGAVTGTAGAQAPLEAEVQRWIVRVDAGSATEADAPLPSPSAIDDAQDDLAVALEDDEQAIRDLRAIPYSVVEASAEEIDRLLADGTITRAVPDRLARPSLDVSTAQIGADAVWPTTEGAGRVVAILDTGVQANHNHLAGRVVHQACFADDEDGVVGVGDCPNGQFQQTAPTGPAPDPAEPCTRLPACEHGTHVAAIAASDHGTYTGVAPAAGIMAIQVFHDTGSDISAWLSDVAFALEHVYDQRTAFDIAAVNLSLGAGLFSAGCNNYDGGAVRDAVRRLSDAGIAVVASSGNNGSTTQISFPACVNEVISVGNVLTDKATGGDADEVSASSNASPSLDLLAPGSPITAAIVDTSAPFNATGVKSGTSMAAPHVTGAIALLREARQGEIDGLPDDEEVFRVHGLLDATGACVTDPGNNRVYRRVDIGAAADFTGAPSALLNDVASCSWYEGAVNWLLFEDLAEGYDDNTFRGDDDITRAQVTRMVHRLFGEDPTAHEHPFKDVPTWVEGAVDWINDPNGPGAPNPLAQGYPDNTFRPDDPITRGEVARMLYRAAGEPPGSPAHAFTDVEDWIDGAVSWLTDDLDDGGPLEPIATGYDDDTFRDHLPITRAQVARMLQRFDAAVAP